jgi:hypothetical protein
MSKYTIIVLIYHRHIILGLINNHYGNQEITKSLRDPKVHFYIQKNQSLVPILLPHYTF